MSRLRLPAETYAEGVLNGDRTLIGRSITLIESTLPADQDLAAEVLSLLMPHTGNSYRVGITGVPGVGKSTFIDAFGTHLTSGLGKKLAVLAVDPSSSLTKGSILGDKTRMERLANDPNAFIRPSPSAGSLGGVARKTRETMLICEAAGFDTVLVETVGVGQSEIAVHGMVDFFLLLMLPHAGDELQGIKKGIMEMADALLVNKAEAPWEERARLAVSAYSQAMRLFALPPSGLRPQVGFASALKEEGLDQVVKWMEDYREKTQASGYWHKKRKQQSVAWLRETILSELEAQFYSSHTVSSQWNQTEQAVAEGHIPPGKAADDLIRAWRAGNQEK